jgi:2-polyprenyl-6-methoxyphenol hydroxylase-like FAD-dependent oxidoreductase
MHSTIDTEVVIVGGGIAGGALAAALGGRGIATVVLERQTTYRDRIRGEYLHPWGVAEAGRLGVDRLLLECGGTWVTEIVGYDDTVAPEEAEASLLSITDIRPDLPGALDVGHPQACQSLTDAAVAVGAVVIRGVDDVSIHAGTDPVVRYGLDDIEHELRCRLIVGADGRASAIRRQLGLGLHQSDATSIVTGLLVHGMEWWPTERCALGTEGDLHYFVFPRADGSARLYLAHGADQHDRFTGPERQLRFLDAFRFDCIPSADKIAVAPPAGPVASYPSNDSWIDHGTVAVPGVVLIGDAAGWNNPLIGTGLSIALRDARSVVDVVTGGADWSPAAFADYRAERAERMRRLRVAAALAEAMNCTFTPAGRRRRAAFNVAQRTDQLVGAAVYGAAIAGPEVVPAEAFDDDNVRRILALAG